MAKKDLLNVQKISGVMFEYRTKDFRLLLRVYSEDPDTLKSQFMVNLMGYPKIDGEYRTNGRKFLELENFDTYEEALKVGTRFVEDNFNLIEID